MQNSTQVADYIGSRCRELATLASKSRLRTLQYLLSIAELEARQQTTKVASAFDVRHGIFNRKAIVPVRRKVA